MASLPILTTVILLFVLELNGLVASALLTIMSYELNLKINQINNTFKNITKNSKRIIIYKNIVKYISSHHKLINRVYILSDFWKDFNLIMILVVFPINLIMMHQLLFEEANIFLQVLYVLGSMITYFTLFLIQFLFASISLKIHKMHKTLPYFQWLLNGREFSLNFKLKLLMYFERLNTNNKRIGFSIGSLAVTTFPLFAKVRQFPY